jgi:D-tyrosyl-tRNA(Tyr) deacylase
MKAILQRVSSAKVVVNAKTVSEIGNGLLILLGIAKGDTDASAKTVAQKCALLRIFDDEQGKFNLSVIDVSGEALVVSQFTLLADTSTGRRPSFGSAENPERAKVLYNCFIHELESIGVPTKSGIFGERMLVTLENRGPVTIQLEE